MSVTVTRGDETVTVTFEGEAPDAEPEAEPAGAESENAEDAPTPPADDDAASSDDEDDEKK